MTPGSRTTDPEIGTHPGSGGQRGPRHTRLPRGPRLPGGGAASGSGLRADSGTEGEGVDCPNDQRPVLEHHRLLTRRDLQRALVVEFAAQHLAVGMEIPGEFVVAHTQPADDERDATDLEALVDMVVEVPGIGAGRIRPGVVPPGGP